MKKISGKLITGTMATPWGREGNNTQRVVGEGNFMKENKENMSEQINHTHVTSQKSLRTLGRTLKDSVVPEVLTYRIP